MRRLIILFFIVVLSGCKPSDTYNQSIELGESLDGVEEIMTTMMEESNHNDDTLVPHELFGALMLYNDNILVIDSIAYNVNTEFDGEIYSFNLTRCIRNSNYYLECTDFENDFLTKTELSEPAHLSDIINTISNIDFIEAIDIIQNQYQMTISNNFTLKFELEYFDNRTLDLYYLETATIYDGNSYFYTGDYTVDGIFMIMSIIDEMDDVKPRYDIYYGLN